MRSDGPKWQRRAAGLGLASLVFFEIAALCSPSMILVSIQHKQLNVGAFSYASNFGYKPIGVRKGTHTYACADKKVWMHAQGNDCSNARQAKCGASQAFLLIGVATHLVATITPLTPRIPLLAGVLCSATASFCFLVVWCIWAYLLNNGGTEKATCGVRQPGNDYKGGYAFGATILAWLACTVQTYMMAGPGTAPPAVVAEEVDVYADVDDLDKKDSANPELGKALLPGASGLDDGGAQRKPLDMSGIAFVGPAQAEPDRRFSLHLVALGISLVMWTSILMMAACVAGEPVAENPGYDDQTDDDVSGTCGGPATTVSIVGIVFFALSALAYLTSSWFSGTRKFIFTQEDRPNVVALVTQCKQAAPSLGHRVVCSHTETYTVPVTTVTGPNGQTSTHMETRTRTVVTYTGSSAFFYKSWADASDGLPEWIVDEELVKLKSHRGFSFADQATKAKFEQEGVDLYNANCHRDVQCTVSVVFDFDGYKSHVLCVDEDRDGQDPLILEKWLWWVMVLGGLGWVHRLMLERWSTRLTFQFRKVVSLSDAEIDPQAELIPGDFVEEDAAVGSDQEDDELGGGGGERDTQEYI